MHCYRRPVPHIEYLVAVSLSRLGRGRGQVKRRVLVARRVRALGCRVSGTGSAARSLLTNAMSRTTYQHKRRRLAYKEQYEDDNKPVKIDTRISNSAEPPKSEDANESEVELTRDEYYESESIVWLRQLAT